jgi:hypothetical protein
MKSPGRPSTRREIEQLFWGEIAHGLTGEDAAVAVGAAPAVGTRWFRHAGGMPQINLTVSGRYEYRASVAQWKAGLVTRRPKEAKPAANERLREYVRTACWA